jgi:hypothetical protein
MPESAVREGTEADIDSRTREDNDVMVDDRVGTGGRLLLISRICLVLEPVAKVRVV